LKDPKDEEVDTREERYFSKELMDEGADDKFTTLRAHNCFLSVFQN
jgi:hypothetical protein